MKGQSLIMQFVLFFTVGFSIFLGLSNLFSFYFERTKKNIVQLNRENIAEYISSIATIETIASNKHDFIRYRFNLRNTTTEYFFETELSKDGLKVISTPDFNEYKTSINNLNYTINELVGFFPSAIKHGQLVYDKRLNKLFLSEVT